MIRIVLSFVLASLLSVQVWAGDSDMVLLKGTPEQIGTLWGKQNRERIQKDIEATFLAPAAKAGINRETLIARSSVYLQVAKEMAPHWLEEGRAIARAAGVDEEIYLAFVDGQVRNRFLHECTSYSVPRSQTKDGLILFHKNRDNIDRPQVAPIVTSTIEGVNKFIAISDVSRITCSMMVNEKGLAGAADFPADKKKDSSDLKLPDAPPQYRGLMCDAILRHIAERAGTCAEALAIIEEFVAKGYYAGGDVNGTHWLFVDRNGVILEVCNNSRHVVSKVHSDRPYMSRLTKSQAAQKLQEAKEPIDFFTFHNLSRDPSICFGSSISGMTVEIDPQHPGLLSCAWIALPARTVAFPVLIGQESTPACLVDGSANQLGKESPRQLNRWETLEKSVRQSKEKLREELAGSIDAGNPHEAHVQAMEQWSSEQAAMLMKELQRPE